MRKTIVTSVMLLTFGLVQAANCQDQEIAKAPGLKDRLSWRLFLSADQYKWKEIDVDGTQLLTEKGYLPGFGGELVFELVKNLQLDGRLSMYTGEVDYDGALQSETGELTPYKSHTTYTGFRGQIDLAYELHITDRLHFDPYVGLGGKAWSRDLDRRADETSLGQYGYTENWTTSHAAIGIKATIPLGAKAELFGRVEGRVTIANNESVDLSNLDGGTVTLTPKKKDSISAEAGVKVFMITASAFYETYDTEKSDVVGRYEVYQPKSQARILGARIGVQF